MKRIIAVSDSHGASTALREAFEQARRRGRVDVAVFLGDGMRDFEPIRSELERDGVQCYAVQGNNDWHFYEPPEIVFSVNGVKIYATHGHMWHVKYTLDRLWYAAREREAQVALYGHTHREKIDLEHGLTLVNPGSVGERGPNCSAYAEILVEDNGFVIPSLVKWE